MKSIESSRRSIADRHSSGAIRRDLIHWRQSDPKRPMRMVFDEISGKFSRLTESLWQRLHHDGLSSREDRASQLDSALWDQAAEAGWTRERTGPVPKIFSPLYFRLPLFPVDRLAAVAARYSGFLFGTMAMRIWSAVLIMAGLVLVGDFDRLADSLARMPRFYAQTHPASIVLILVATKLIHELAHAVMCRRIGARCGSIGVLFLCGIPCPYCDVTQVWRIPSSLQRSMVMGAGIYVELILASLAALLWWSTDAVWLQFHALNIMLVCGISSLLFNANPLMRYDGYYLLGDAIGSVNLRRESKQAFESVFWQWFSKSHSSGIAADGLTPRQHALAFYHVASSCYRTLMLMAIGMVLFTVSDWFDARRIVTSLLAALASVWLWRMGARIYRMIIGQGRWKGFSMQTRVFLVGGAIAFVAAFLILPLPRKTEVSGIIDAADATQVFLTVDGVIDQVPIRYGDHVGQGKRLVTVRNDRDIVRAAQLQGKIRVASLRSRRARQETLKDDSAQAQWRSAQVVEDALRASYVSTAKQVDQAVVRAPIAGIVVPASPITRSGTDPPSHPLLGQLPGSRSEKGQPWCRISATQNLFAIIEIDAVHRQHIQVGDRVRIDQAMHPGKIVDGEVISISAIRDEQRLVTRDALFEVLCALPTEKEDPLSSDVFISQIGGACRAVIDLPARSVWEDLIDIGREIIR